MSRPKRDERSLGHALENGRSRVRFAVETGCGRRHRCGIGADQQDVPDARQRHLLERRDLASADRTELRAGLSLGELRRVKRQRAVDPETYGDDDVGELSDRRCAGLLVVLHPHGDREVARERLLQLLPDESTGQLLSEREIGRLGAAARVAEPRTQHVGGTAGLLLCALLHPLGEPRRTQVLPRRGAARRPRDGVQVVHREDGVRVLRQRREDRAGAAVLEELVERSRVAPSEPVQVALREVEGARERGDAELRQHAVHGSRAAVGDAGDRRGGRAAAFDVHEVPDPGVVGQPRKLGRETLRSVQRSLAPGVEQGDPPVDAVGGVRQHEEVVQHHEVRLGAVACRDGGRVVADLAGPDGDLGQFDPLRQRVADPPPVRPPGRQVARQALDVEPRDRGPDQRVARADANRRRDLVSEQPPQVVRPELVVDLRRELVDGLAHLRDAVGGRARLEQSAGIAPPLLPARVIVESAAVLETQRVERVVRQQRRRVEPSRPLAGERDPRPRDSGHQREAHCHRRDRLPGPHRGSVSERTADRRRRDHDHPGCVRASRRAALISSPVSGRGVRSRWRRSSCASTRRFRS